MGAAGVVGASTRDARMSAYKRQIKPKKSGNFLEAPFVRRVKTLKGAGMALGRMHEKENTP